MPRKSYPKRGNRYGSMRYSAKSAAARRNYKFTRKLADKKINTLWERRAQEIAQETDDTSPWLRSRVDHLKSPFEFASTHKSPNLSQMIKPSGNVMWWQDISQLTVDPSDPLNKGMDSGLYQVKTIQSRLRFYALGLFPIHVRVAIIKISNSGAYGKTAINPTLVNADVNPTAFMLGDTSLRYSGIHSQEMKTTAPGVKSHSIIAQAKFTITPKTWNSIPPQTDNTVSNPGLTTYLAVLENGSHTGGSPASATFPATTTTSAHNHYGYGFQNVAEKQITLTKTYKNYLKIIQTLNQTALDDKLTADQNKCKSIGDRFFLAIYADHQQDWSVAPNLPTYDDQINKTSTLYFYGVSGCIYNYDKKQTQVSVPLPDDAEITNTSY